MIEGAEGAGLAGDIHYGSDPSGCGQSHILKMPQTKYMKKTFSMMGR